MLGNQFVQIKFLSNMQRWNFLQIKYYSNQILQIYGQITQIKYHIKLFAHPQCSVQRTAYSVQRTALSIDQSTWRAGVRIDMNVRTTHRCRSVKAQNRYSVVYYGGTVQFTVEVQCCVMWRYNLDKCSVPPVYCGGTLQFTVPAVLVPAATAGPGRGLCERPCWPGSRWGLGQAGPVQYSTVHSTQYTVHSTQYTVQ